MNCQYFDETAQRHCVVRSVVICSLSRTRLTLSRRQSKTPILLRSEDQKSLKTEFSIAICRHTGKKWQSKTLFLSIFSPHSSIVDSIFGYRLPGVRLQSMVHQHIHLLFLPVTLILRSRSQPLTLRSRSHETLPVPVKFKSATAIPRGHGKVLKKWHFQRETTCQEATFMGAGLCFRLLSSFLQSNLLSLPIINPKQYVAIISLLSRTH